MVVISCELLKKVGFRIFCSSLGNQLSAIANAVSTYIIISVSSGKTDLTLLIFHYQRELGSKGICKLIGSPLFIEKGVRNKEVKYAQLP